MTRAAHRAGALLLVALLALATAALGMLALPAAPARAATTGEFAGRLAFRLSQVDPVVVTAASGDTVTLVGRYTNTGAEPIDDISFRFQRGDALTTAAAVNAAAAEPAEPVAVVNSVFRPLPGEVAPGASTPFAITVATSGDTADTLAIDAPGVYPVMLNVNGVVHRNGAQQEARVGELHLLVTVASMPDSTGDDQDAAARPVSILWPLVDRPHLAVNGIFADDALAGEVAPGGRLNGVLSALIEADADPDLVSVLVDPMLLDELQRMADGYQVLTAGSAQPALPQPAVSEEDTAPKTGAAAGAAQGGTHEATTSPSTPASTDPGSGQAAAAAFLDALRAVAAVHRVVLLPYGDADLAALSRAGMTDEASYAVTRGRDIATRVLVRGPDATAIMDNLVTDVAVPVGGEMTTPMWQLLAGLGMHGAVLAPGSITPDDDKPKALTDGVFSLNGSGQAVLTGGEWAASFGAIATGTAAGPQAAVEPARAVNLLAAELQVAPSADRAPVVVLPDRRFTASSGGLAALSDLVDELAPSNTLRAASIGLVLAAEQPPAALAYSAAAQKRELSLRYLQHVAAVRDQIALLSRALGQAEDGPAPRDVLGPLNDALLPAVSAAWRGDADPAAANLRTVEATLVWLYGGVQISRDTGSYTLASSTAPLLLAVRNTLPYEVTVRVQLVGGEQAGLTATDPGLVTIGAGPRSVPIKLDTSVSRSGTFRVFAQLSGPDGVTWGGQVPLTIDSRAYGPLTVILMAAAGGVLLIMVIWRLVQRLRGKGRSPGDELAPAGDDGNADTGDDVLADMRDEPSGASR